MGSNQIKALLATIILILSNTYLESCSRVFWDNKINKIAARTVDLYMNENPIFALLPRGLKREGEAGPESVKWTSKYGSVVITAFDGKAVSEGMNEKGLCGHLLYLYGTEYEKRDDRPGLANTMWIQYIIDNCANVNEAVESLKNYQIVSNQVAGRDWPLHACLEDKTGDSAIIEFVKGRMVVHHGPQFKVMTNEPPYNVQIQNLKHYRYFGGKLPLPGDIDSESRFVRCSAFLSTLPEPNNLQEAVGYIYGVIRTVQVPFGAEDTSSTISEDTWSTRWASAADLTHLTYYFNSTSTPNIIWVEFAKLDFSQGQPIRNIDVQNRALVGDVSDRFK